MGNSCTLVSSIDLLQPGDHVAYKTGLFHYQHAIVVSVNSQKELTIVRFRESIGHGAANNPRVHTHVREEELDVSDFIQRQQIYRYNYRFYDSYLPGAVVDRARRGALGYDPQQFCYWCKTGRKMSPRACVAMTTVCFLFVCWVLFLWFMCRWTWSCSCSSAPSPPAADEL